ncbi:MAG: hypothetical protein HYV16_02545 [Gammaproteobacteria bacterium]|nr:hypothetical protein [Gammaproteobacteria bacterium]
MKRTLSVALTLSLALSACGFHLRGSGGHALAAGTPVAFEAAQEESEFARLVQRKLEGAEAALVSGDKTPGARRVHVGAESLERRELTVNTLGRVAEYELILSVPVTLAAPGAEAKEQVLSARREYTYDRNRVISMGEQEAFLLTDMRRDLADQLMRRLERVAR